MTSLYWRIFLSFWLALALILIGTVSVVVDGGQKQRFWQTWIQRSELYSTATQAFSSRGAEGLRQWYRALPAKGVAANTFIVDAAGNEMFGRSVPDFLLDSPERLEAEKNSKVAPTARGLGGGLVLVGQDGKMFHVMVGPFSAGPRLFGELDMPAISTATLLIALVVSAVICFFLARYLVGPVDQLRHATRQIASGDLNV